VSSEAWRLQGMDWIAPDWPAPATVRAVVTTRQGGASLGPYASMNLGDHVGDTPEHVLANRATLAQIAQLPRQPLWLRQVHGADVLVATAASLPQVEADAAVTRAKGVVCGVMTADCLPVFFCDRRGTRVGVAHAGWRGLANGVLAQTVAALGCAPSELMAWLGPAIGPRAFQVGHDVVDAFVQADPAAAAAFAPQDAERWLADIYALARLRLHAAGVTQVYGGTFCTHTDAARFFSYRRDGITGRMASLIWLELPHQG
jgi:polyphenol oxidase